MGSSYITLESGLKLVTTRNVFWLSKVTLDISGAIEFNANATIDISSSDSGKHIYSIITDEGASGRDKNLNLRLIYESA